jgi:hypothetical protein
VHLHGVLSKVGDAHNPVSRTYCCKTDLNSCFLFVFYSNKLLKKTKLKGRTYLSIDESFYSHDKKGTAHRCFKSLGSVETHLKNGIEDPISHFQEEVDALNKVRNDDGVKKISDKSHILYMGYFLLKSILEKLCTQLSHPKCGNAI